MGCNYLAYPDGGVPAGGSIHCRADLPVVRRGFSGSNDRQFNRGGTAFQVTVFLAVSAVLLTALRPLLRRYVTPKLTKTNVDSVIGSTGYVTAAIDNMSAQGQVKLGAMYWTARSSSGAPIAEGTLVRADRIEGVKVFVSPAEVPANI